MPAWTSSTRLPSHSWPWRSLGPWAAACGVAALLALGGCASGPGGPGGTGGARVPERASERPPGRDGPPPQGAAPTLAELASQPDPVPQVEPIRAGGPNKPYVVMGQSYEPLAADVPWRERGGASWYGHKFHGRRTASGELYSMYGLTAAHKTLPIPSYVRVRSVRSGKEIIVRVNDRGPFHGSRVIDLSYAAAVKLDIAASGTGEVELSRLTFDEIRAGAWQRGTVLDADPVTASAVPPSDDTMGDFATRVATRPAVPSAPPAAAVPAAAVPLSGRAHTPASKGFWVQLATLGKREGVDRLQQRIGQQVEALLPMLAVFHEPPFFKLQAGPYTSRAEAQAAAAQARRALQLDPMVVERR
ncbi:MAG: septal ring lytic transglycosylase RlpA family protein [Pseudomonadota bacterium]